MKSVEGIILKKTPRREADVIVTLYTREHGLMELVAKSARKQEAKLKAGLDLFNHVEVFYVPAKRWPIATDFKIKNDFRLVKNEIKRLKLASFLAYVINRVFEPGLADPAVWHSVLNYFNTINRSDLARENMRDVVYLWCHDILVLNGLDPKSPDFKPMAGAELKKKTQELFRYHFGIAIDL